MNDLNKMTLREVLTDQNIHLLEPSFSRCIAKVDQNLQTIRECLGDLTVGQAQYIKQLLVDMRGLNEPASKLIGMLAETLLHMEMAKMRSGETPC